MSHLWRLISHRSQHSESTNRPPRHHAFRLEPWVQSLCLLRVPSRARACGCRMARREHRRVQLLRLPHPP